MYRHFTLLELVVAMAVIALSTGLAVATFRGESDSRTMENFILNLEAYFSRVRYRATEEGTTWEVYFDAPNRTFSACRRMTAAEYEALDRDGDAPPPVLKWSCPEKITVSTTDVSAENAIETVDRKVSIVEQRREEEDASSADYVPPGERMFYFYADGFVGGKYRIEAECCAVSRALEVSPLTGRLIEAGGDKR